MPISWLEKSRRENVNLQYVSSVLDEQVCNVSRQLPDSTISYAPNDTANTLPNDSKLSDKALFGEGG